MSHSIVKSTGFLDVTPPEWFQQLPTLRSTWGRLLLALNKFATVRHIKKSGTLQLWPNEVALIIEGGLLATRQRADDESRTLLVGFMQRGDLLTSALTTSISLSLTAHCSTTCLVLPISAMDDFAAEYPEWGSVCPIMLASLAQSYLEAVDTASGHDEARIQRVLLMLANHPTAVVTRLGREVEAGKQQIRDLAGVQKRSATRAFASLEKRGVVSFDGYKRLFVKC